MQRRIRISFLLGIVLLSAPLFALAQSPNEDLRNAIQASVLADPRVADIPPVQLRALVDSLYAQAQAQNMTAADILWRPQTAQAATTYGDASSNMQTENCASGAEGYLCQFNKAFGFEGSNYEIPIFLLITSAFLAAVIWELIVHHRKKMAAKSAAVSAGPAKRQVS